MFFLENIRSALDAIWSNKLRSGLTMLGIMIGVASVVLMVAIGRGAPQSDGCSFALPAVRGLRQYHHVG